MESTHSPVTVCHLPITAIDFQYAVSKIASAEGPGRSVHFVNANTVVDAHDDSDYLDTLRSAWMLLPDGAPIARLVSKAADTYQQRVPGPDIFESLLELPGLRHFLIAPNAATLEALECRWRDRIVGSIIPEIVDHQSFPFEDAAKQIERATASHVWIALGSPKQDLIARKLATRVSAVTLAVGAAMEFSAGIVPRAPLLLRKFNLEWLHRLLSDPRRLWKRYLIGNLRFIRISRSTRA